MEIKKKMFFQIIKLHCNDQRQWHESVKNGTTPSSILSLSIILILYSNLLLCYLFIICIPRKFNVKWFCNNLSIRTRIGRILMRKIAPHLCIICRLWEGVKKWSGKIKQTNQKILNICLSRCFVKVLKIPENDH